MKYKLSPQVSDKVINYEFDNEKITARMDELVNTYDLSNLTDKFYKDTVTENGDIVIEEYIIETVFNFKPIINAYRDEMGTLWVELLNFISKDAPEDVKNPDWIIIN